MRITFITSNPTKFKIAQEVLSMYNITIEQRTMNISELQTIDLDAVVMDKAKQAAKTSNDNFIVDDSGLYVDALWDFPGALLKPTIAAIGQEKFLRLMSSETNRKARFVSELVFHDSKTNEFTLIPSTICGTLANNLSTGTREVGFSIEKFFVADGETKPIAELTDAEWGRLYTKIKEGLHYKKLGERLSAIG